MNHKFAIGARVAISAKFLRNIGDYSHSSASQRGFVVAVSPITKDRDLITVQWNDGHVSKSLNVNLICADQIHLESR